MMTELDAWVLWASFSASIAGLFSWLAGNREDMDDETVAEAHEFVLDTLSDADTVAKVEGLTGGKNLRQQLTIGQAQALYEEQQQRRMGGRRN